jgi:acyl-CoA dehydrogenase
MRQQDHLDWPFFEERHGILASELDQWAREHVAHIHGPDVDNACRTLVRELGQAARPAGCATRSAAITASRTSSTRAPSA